MVQLAIMRPLIFREILDPIIEALFPRYCAGCERTVTSSEEIVCFECKSSLPYTKMENYDENAAAIRMLTRLPFEHAFSLLYFIEKGSTRHLLHNLKYKNQPDVGIYLGKLIGEKLSKSTWGATLEGIIPIPLHRKKEASRGYNQSELIAEGISKILGIPVLEKAVVRCRNTESQTDKNRSQRAANVANAFEVKDAKMLSDKHILLVDDVLTTGATLSACGKAILDATDCKISIATVALTQH